MDAFNKDAETYVQDYNDAVANVIIDPGADAPVFPSTLARRGQEQYKMPKGTLSQRWGKGRSESTSRTRGVLEWNSSTMWSSLQKRLSRS